MRFDGHPKLGHLLGELTKICTNMHKPSYYRLPLCHRNDMTNHVKPKVPGPKSTILLSSPQIHPCLTCLAISERLRFPGEVQQGLQAAESLGQCWAAESWGGRKSFLFSNEVPQGPWLVWKKKKKGTLQWFGRRRKRNWHWKII